MDRKHRRIVQKARTFCNSNPSPFNTNDDILEIASCIFEIRSLLGYDGNVVTSSFEKQMTRMFHQCLKLSSSSLYLVHVCKRYKFNQCEKEILLLLILADMGTINNFGRIRDIQKAMYRNAKQSIDVARALKKDGRLRSSRVVKYNKFASDYEVSKSFMSSILNKKSSISLGWDVKTYDELLDRTYEISRAASQRMNSIENENTFKFNEAELHNATHDIEDSFYKLESTSKKHPTWPINELQKSGLNDAERLMIIVLMSKEIGFFSQHSKLFTGIGLARCASVDVPFVRHNLSLLKKECRLRQRGYVRVCGGKSSTRVVEDEGTLQDCEFELTAEMVKKLQLPRCRKSKNSARKAIIRPDQLVLSEKIRSSIDMCIAQVRNKTLLFEEWGLEKTINYGAGVTILFSGPPGTGKTASAEAIAYELEKPIIVADYSEVQNCWVGETEKNITKLFREAHESDAVLFWDEADAMFYDRNTASKNWEVRDVNVLLQELEHFEGVCILSTNRKTTLDKALERRISMKIEFDRPNQKCRKLIWQKLIPQDMPLDRNICFEELSQADLCGGEIKNVVMNAARLALKRNPISLVSEEDFLHAIEIERNGRWNLQHEGFGFRSMKKEKHLYE